ncbi:MAG: hypothetical protein GYA55_10835, partial [SAR324 cluster bacterium]|nr:hypothetical protein [SAR324 cluster bacterium]
MKGIRPNPLVFSLKGDTLLETAQNIMHYAHQGQKRQSGEDYTEHLKRVSLGTQDLIKYDHKEMRELAASLGLLHDSIEDSKDITLSLLFSVVSCFGRARAIFVQDIISRLTRTTQTYKAYTEDLFRDAPSEENLLARAIKLEDRIDNTKLGEEFDPETYREAYERLAEATQTQLFMFYKEKDVLFITSDQKEEPLSLYENGVLLYDKDLFERACRQRFRIKIATNASDNLNFFLPEFQEKLLAIAEKQDTSIDPNKVREHMWYLYVSSLDVLESFGRGGIQDILYYSLKREAMQFEGNRFDDAMRLPMLHQIQVLYVAGLYGLTGPDGKKIGKDAWRDPNSWKIPNHTMTYKDVRELFLGKASSDSYKMEDPTNAETVGQNKSSQQTLPPLRRYNSNENIIEWAKEVAKALHGESNRESG